MTDGFRAPDAPPCMRVVMIEPVGSHGGMAAYDAGLCAGLHAAGCEVLLSTSAMDRPVEGAEVATLYQGVFGPSPAWRRGLRWLRATVQSLRAARSRGARVCHLHLFQATGLEFVNALGARLAGLRLVVTAHDVASLAGQAEPLARSIYRLADAVIVHNETSANDARGILGLPPDGVHVIPHGHYLESVPTEPPSAAVARRQLGLPAAGPIALFFGQIKRAKGLDLLLRAWPSVRARHPQAQLVVAGRPWKDETADYEALVADGSGVHLRWGYVAEEDVPLYYAAASVVVLPYRRIYQSGVLLLAQSYGRPVLASDLPAMREVLGDGQTGYLFASENPDALAARLSDVLDDPARAEEVGRAGRQALTERHDWRTIGSETARLYAEVCGAVGEAGKDRRWF